MRTPWGSIRPGWYLLAILLLYGIVVTVVAARQGERVEELRQEMVNLREVAERAPEPQEDQEDTGLWIPIPGAVIPDNPAHLPNAARPYRNGVSQGFDFYDGESGVPVPYGAAVVASASGTVVRADRNYSEVDPAEWEQLLEDVENGASEDQLDRLRGRQVWLETSDGRLLRYAHLSAIRESLREGQEVERGQVLGFVGNSGTDEGVAGTTRGVRLHFEIWEDETFFGEGMDAEEILIASASLFTGP